MPTVTERLAILITAHGGQATSEISKTGGALGGLTKAQAGAAVGALAVAKQLWSASQAASALREQVTAAEIVFGDANGTVNEFADRALGMTKTQALEAANSLGGLFTNIGATNQQAATASSALIALANDVASLRNVQGGANEVMAKFQSALAGEIEPVRKWGIDVTEAAVKAQALAMGLGEAGRELTQNEKILARYQLLVKGTANAQGNAALTAGDQANQQRQLNAEYGRAQEQLGQAVLPALNELTRAGVDSLQVVNNLAGAFGDLKTAGEVFSNLQILSGGLQQVRNLGDLFSGKAGFFDSGIDIMRKRSKAQANADDTAKRLAEATKALSQVNLSNVVSEKDVTKAVEDAEDATWDLMHAQEALEDAHKGVGKAARDERQAQADLDKLLQQGAVDTKKVADAQRNLAAATEGVVSAVDAQSKAQRNLDQVKKGSNPRDVRKAELDLADAKRNQQRAIFGVADAQGELNDIVNVGVLQDGQHTGSIQSVAEAQLALEDALQGVEESSLATADAQDRLTELQNFGKEGSTSLKDAQQELADATERVVEATRDQGEAQAALVEAQAGDLEFADKVTEAQERVAEAHDRVADAKRNERDATHELAEAQERENEAKRKARENEANQKARDVSNPSGNGGGVLGALGAALTLNLPLHIDGREVAKATVTYTADELAKMARRAGLS